MSISPGMHFGPYEVGQSIGAGGMGEVYRAYDGKLKRDVAVKVLPQAFVEDADRLARFQREAEILASLNHPNIAQVYGLEEVDGQTAIVMELVEGPTLADRIQEGPIPVDESMAIILQVAAALEAAHEKQIVHRDLKPANVKVRSDGTVKVLDFGISKPMDASAISGAPVMTTPAVTQTGVILGTAAYMSPEQARGRPVDQRTDIWAFGCLLFEMLTGQPAFRGEDVMATLARVIDRETDLSSVPKTLSPAARHTIRLCLEKDPKRRIADIRDVRLALEGTFESELPRVPEAVPVRARQRALPFAAGAVLAAVLAVLVMSYLDRPGPPEPRPVRRSAHMVPPEQVWNNNFGPRLVELSPDGSQFVYAADDALYLRSLDELEARVIPGSEGEVPIVPVFSADGNWLIYRALRDQQVKRIPVAGGTPLPIVADGETIVSWRPDAGGAISFCREGRISRVATTGGEPELLAEVSSPNCFYPFVVPGTDVLIYMRRDPADLAADDIVALSLATGELTPLFPGRQPYYVEPFLIYTDQNLGLMARRFDPETLAIGSAVSFGYDIFQRGPGAAPQFSVAQNGSLIYLEGTAADQTAGGIPLSVVDASGNVRRLRAPADDYRFPAASPNGDQIAMTVVGDGVPNIWIYDTAGTSEIRQLTFDGRNAQPVWSKNGEWVIFFSDRDGSSRLWRQRANGREAAEPLTGPFEAPAVIAPAFTSDGERLAWAQRSAGGDIDIWIMDYPDGEAEPFVGGSGDQFGIAFSTDGAAMSYTSTASGSLAIMLEPYPKEGGSGFRISEEGVDTAWPVWSRDSSRISYQTADGSFGIVDVDTGSLRTSNRRQLALGGDPNQRRADSMPGDDALVLTVGGGINTETSSGPAPRLIIVENWIEEVKQRVPEN